MDVKRLDQVAKKLIASIPRREAVKTVAGGISVALVARLGMGGADVEAGDCRKRRRSCNRRGQCCGKKTACREFPTATCSILERASLLRTGRGIGAAMTRTRTTAIAATGSSAAASTGRGRCQEEPVLENPCAVHADSRNRDATATRGRQIGAIRNRLTGACSQVQPVSAGVAAVRSERATTAGTEASRRPRFD